MTTVNLKFIAFLGEGIGWLKLNQLKKANGGGNAQESNAELLTKKVWSTPYTRWAHRRPLSW